MSDRSGLAQIAGMVVSYTAEGTYAFSNTSSRTASAIAIDCLRSIGSALDLTTVLITTRMPAMPTVTMTMNMTSSIRVSPRWRCRWELTHITRHCVDFDIGRIRYRQGERAGAACRAGREEIEVGSPQAARAPRR